MSEYIGVPEGWTPEAWQRQMHTEYDLWLTTNNREVARQTVQEVIAWLESPEEGPLFCYDKCGDPQCVEDMKINLVERIVQGLKERFK